MWKKIILEKMKSSKSLLIISKSGISFSAKFIKDNDLGTKDAIEFFDNSNNEYQLGFKFLDETGDVGSNALMRNRSGSNRNKTQCAGRNLKASELINNKKVLKSIQQEPLKQNRMFEIKKSKDNPSMYYVNFSPIFENTVRFDYINNLDYEVRGIYRYLDQNGETIYIGKGNIKERAKTTERSEWGIKKIEYSIIEENDQMLQWEEYHIARFVEDHGVKPLFNKIMGTKVKAA